MAGISNLDVLTQNFGIERDLKYLLPAIKDLSESIPDFPLFWRSGPVEMRTHARISRGSIRYVVTKKPREITCCG
jgi:hypothetical protein